MGEEFFGVDVVDGSTVKWGVLTTSALGGLGAALGTGITETIEAAGSGLSGAITGLWEFSASVIATPYKGISRAISLAWGNDVAGSGVFGRGGRALIPLPNQSFATAIGDLGLLAYPVSLAAGLFTLYGITWVMNRV